MYRVKIDPSLMVRLKRLKIKYRVAVGAVFEELTSNPYLGKPLDRELAERFTYRVGVYRIIYKIYEKDKVVVVLDIDHRSKVYD